MQNYNTLYIWLDMHATPFRNHIHKTMIRISNQLRMHNMSTFDTISISISFQIQLTLTETRQMYEGP
jgi:hypothetical protein